MKQVVPWGWFKRKSSEAKCNWICRELCVSKDICSILQKYMYERVCVSDVIFSKLPKEKGKVELYLKVYQRFCQQKTFGINIFKWGLDYIERRHLMVFFATLFAECGADVYQLPSALPILDDVMKLAITNTRRKRHVLYFPKTQGRVFFGRKKPGKVQKVTLVIQWEEMNLLFDIQP